MPPSPVTGGEAAAPSPFADAFTTPIAPAPSVGAVGTRLPSFGGVTLPERTIYLDNAAATALCRSALEAMLPFLSGLHGNPSNRLHPMGELAEYAVADARRFFAGALRCRPEEIVFASCATEANNLLLRGIVEHPMRKRRKLVIGATEHSCVLATALKLGERHAGSLEVVVLPVDSHGQIALEAARAAIDFDTCCVAVMDVNNETGVVQEGLPTLARLANEAGAPLHVDAVQGLARGPFETTATHYDSVVVSGAKMHGPKGCAVLAVRRPPKGGRPRLEAQLTGGGQEGNMRSGTPNVPAIVAFAQAARWYLDVKERGLAHMRSLEDTFLAALGAGLAGRVPLRVHGEGATRVAGILSVHLEGVNAMKLVEEARRVCVSVGSACRTLQATASHVLLAMGLSEEEALASVRVSFGLPNSREEAAEAGALLAEAALKVRSYSAIL